MPAITIPLVPCWRLFTWFSVKSSFTGAVRDIQNLIICLQTFSLGGMPFDWNGVSHRMWFDVPSVSYIWSFWLLWESHPFKYPKTYVGEGVGCSAFYIPGVNPLDPMFLWFSYRICYNMKLTTEKVKESCDVHRNSDTFYEQNQASWKKKRIQKSSVSVHNISSVLYYLSLQKKYSSS